MRYRIPNASPRGSSSFAIVARILPEDDRIEELTKKVGRLGIYQCRAITPAIAHRSLAPFTIVILPLRKARAGRRSYKGHGVDAGLHEHVEFLSGIQATNLQPFFSARRNSRHLWVARKPCGDSLERAVIFACIEQFGRAVARRLNYGGNCHC